MKTLLLSRIFLGLMGLAFCKVGVETLIDPQSVLQAVSIELNNPSALSSMRAIYGGMHLTFGLFCFYGIWKDVTSSLKLLILYTSGFVLGRVSGWAIDGKPNDFVTTWLITEAVSLILSLVLMWSLNKKLDK